jgi:hypothetical protein
MQAGIWRLGNMGREGLKFRLWGWVWKIILGGDGMRVARPYIRLGVMPLAEV